MNISRLKFDIDELVNEILDHIPEEMFSRDDTTFLDPEMGGGQFVKETEKRLRSYGHSDENISSRVTGFASSKIQLNYVVRKHRLLGQYSIFNIMENELSNKFDVVIGNPPYQNPGKSKGEPLWPKFVFKSNEIVKNGGIVSLIIPSAWMTAGYNGASRKSVYDDVLKNNSLLIANVKSDLKDYFNVSSKFSYIIFKKEKNEEKKTKFYTDDGVLNINLNEKPFLPLKLSKTTLSILEKTMFSQENFYIKHIHKALPKKNPDRSEEPNEKHIYKHWVIGGSLDENIYYTYLPYDRVPEIRNVKKVMFPIGGADRFSPYIDFEKIGMCQQGFYVPLEEDDDYDAVISVFYSKIFKYLTTGIRASRFFKVNMLKNLPKISMKTKWTDQKLYDYFNLTQEEIDYIEENI